MHMVIKLIALLLSLSLPIVVQAEKKQTNLEKKAEQLRVATEQKAIQEEKKKAELENIPMQDSFLERQVTFNKEIPPLAGEMLLTFKLAVNQMDYQMSMIKLARSAAEIRDLQKKHSDIIFANKERCKIAERQKKNIEESIANLKLDATKFFSGSLPVRFMEQWEQNTKLLKDGIAIYDSRAETKVGAGCYLAG